MPNSGYEKAQLLIKEAGLFCCLRADSDSNINNEDLPNSKNHVRIPNKIVELLTNTCKNTTTPNVTNTNIL